jgi:hypothetical protein
MLEPCSKPDRAFREPLKVRRNSAALAWISLGLSSGQCASLSLGGIPTYFQSYQGLDSALNIFRVNPLTSRSILNAENMQIDIFICHL